MVVVGKIIKLKTIKKNRDKVREFGFENRYLAPRQMQGLMTPQAEMPSGAFFIQQSIILGKRFNFTNRDMKKLYMLNLHIICYLHIRRIIQ